MAGGRPIIPLLLAAAVLGACGTPAAPAWHRSSVAESPIVFSGKRFDHSEHVSVTATGYEEFLAAYWDDGPLPRAEVVHSRLLPGFFWLQSWTIPFVLGHFRFLAGRDLEFEKPRYLSTRLGTVTYRRFSFAGAGCVGFGCGWAPSGAANTGDTLMENTNNVFGYLCRQGTLDTARIEAMLQGIAIRADRTPPPAAAPRASGASSAISWTGLAGFVLGVDDKQEH